MLILIKTLICSSVDDPSNLHKKFHAPNRPFQGEHKKKKCSKKLHFELSLRSGGPQISMADHLKMLPLPCPSATLPNMKYQFFVPPPSIAPATELVPYS